MGAPERNAKGNGAQPDHSTDRPHADLPALNQKPSSHKAGSLVRVRAARSVKDLSVMKWHSGSLVRPAKKE
jgi:hypothetical protein